MTGDAATRPDGRSGPSRAGEGAPLAPHDLIALFGTPAADPPPERLEAGPLAVEIAGGAIVRVEWRGAEVLRGIAYPVRDRNWFTHADRTIGAEGERRPGGATFRRRFETAEGAITGRFACDLQASGRLVADLSFRAERDVTVNRAGFVVLHPIADEAGTPLRVTHPDGTERETSLPRLISPGQPVRDIRALAYAVPAAAIRLRFEGDVFEMEDQRNWTDASFKTYCRPLALPFPYDIPAGTVWEQRITLDLSGGSAAPRRGAAEPGLSIGPAGAAPLPAVAFAHEEGWGAMAAEPPSGALLVLRADLREEGAAARAAAFLARSPAPVEIEAVLPDEARGLDAALAGLRDALAAAQATPASLTVLPAAYLVSHQPEGRWPAGPDPVEARAAAVARFPGLPVGTGVLTNFTELNRLPRRDPRPDFVTYGTTAIVHAADDRSVMQTLEALPQVHASAAALYPGAPIRLGLVAIGMRSNPYGSACAPNPDLVRKAGAMLDPRQAGLFAAAFMVGAVAATAGQPVARIVLGALAGPFALLDGDGSARPAWHVARALAGLSGARRRPVAAPPGLAGLAATGADGATTLIVADTTGAPRSVDLPPGARAFVLDHRSAGAWRDPRLVPPLEEPPARRVALGPYGVLIARLPAGA